MNNNYEVLAKKQEQYLLTLRTMSMNLLVKKCTMFMNLMVVNLSLQINLDTP